MHLVDAVNKKKYQVILDAEKKCLCSDGLSSEIPAKSRINVWAKLPAPPEDVQQVTVSGATQDLALKEIDTEIQIDLAADVLFEFDSAEFQPEAQDALAKAAAVIRERAKGTVRIAGHTDAKGADDYNQRLSEQRANAVRDWFVGQGGLSGVRFETQGFGETRPVAPNTKPDGADDPEGRQKNRRVEIRIEK